MDDLLARIRAAIEDTLAEDRRFVPTHLKILEFTDVLRADYRDSDADYLVGLLADAYEIPTD